MQFVGSVLLPGSLWFIMLSMGLSLTLEDFRRVFASRRALLVGIVSMMVALPVLGILIAVTFAPTPALAMGYFLLATCPGGMLSNLMTDIAKGDLALSLSLTLVVSTIYIFTIPFYAHVALLLLLDVDTAVSVPFLQFFWQIFSITLVPVSLGLLVRHQLPALANRIKPAIKIVATLVLVAAFIAIMVDQVEILRQTLGTLFAMVLGMNVLALAIAYLASTAARINPAERKAVCIEHLIRQEGTAIFIAVSVLGSKEMSLPMIVNTPVALVLCIAFVLASRHLAGRLVAARP